MKKLASVGNFALVIGSHDILDSDRFGLVCLFLLVAIHDGDGHDEEADVDLRKEGREVGGRRDWEICSVAIFTPKPTSMMAMTGATKAQMK